MPRIAREKSETGIYHIMIRGINKQKIFDDYEDKARLFETFRRFKQTSKFDLYGYCFLSNHLHLLIKETTEPVSMVVKRISSSYVFWFNHKYERFGHLFQERFKSEAVEDDSYFLTVLRYIHQNPIKAGITNSLSEYKWSSYREYLTIPYIIDIDFALNIFSTDREKAVKLFRTFMNEKNSDSCLDMDDKPRVSDDEIKAKLREIKISDFKSLQQMERKERDRIIKSLKAVDGVTVRQLSRLTGISKSAISRI